VGRGEGDEKRRKNGGEGKRMRGGREGGRMEGGRRRKDGRRGRMGGGRRCSHHAWLGLEEEVVPGVEGSAGASGWWPWGSEGPHHCQTIPREE